jgi:uncharacterized protein YutE (UPF0331/DUF86 family)
MKISQRVVADRLDWIDRMVEEIRSLPLNNKDSFFADSRNVWTADACLRRALEALFDLGRHILAKGFGQAPSEYKEVAAALAQTAVLSTDEANLLRLLAGYRNRLIHFYHEVSSEELYQICVGELGDLERISEAYRLWLKANPDMVDTTL